MHRITVLAATAALALLSAPIADACTRVLWNDNDLAVMVGRTMDWPESTEPILTAFSRGMDRDGGKAGPTSWSPTTRPAGPRSTAASRCRSTASAPPTA